MKCMCAPEAVSNSVLPTQMFNLLPSAFLVYAFPLPPEVHVSELLQLRKNASSPTNIYTKLYGVLP